MLTSQTLLTSANAAANDQANSSLSQLGDDYNKFLTLLTAQISNQDPLKPVDSTQFVAQLAQLSQVEQAVQTNSRLETMTSQISGLMNLGGLDLLGREVTVASNTIILDNGTTGSTYEVAPGAAEVTASIIDPLGRTVRTLTDLPTLTGAANNIGWDGKDDYGNDLLAGKYSLQMIAVDSAGNEIETQVSRTAKVEDVRFREGEIIFGLDGGETVSSVTVKSAS